MPNKAFEVELFLALVPRSSKSCLNFALAAESGWWGTDHKLYLNVCFEREPAFYGYLAAVSFWPLAVCHDAGRADF